jgi:HEPN domain-containing protein
MTEINPKIKYWVDLSDYDIDTAEAMLKTKRFLYVGFMCHQVIEKILKAYFVFIKNEIPPYTHNLRVLAKETNLYELLSEKQNNFIEQLEPLNIEARYPEYKEKLLKFLTNDKCLEIIFSTKEFQLWIKQKLLIK